MPVAKKKQSPLRAALDNERGKNYALQKQRKQEKAAAKRKGTVPGYASHAKKGRTQTNGVAEEDAIIESEEDDENEEGLAEANEELDSGSVSDDEDDEEDADEVAGTSGRGVSLADQIKKLAAAARRADPDRNAKGDALLKDDDDRDEDEEEDDDEEGMGTNGVSLKAHKAPAQDDERDQDNSEEEDDDEEEDIPLSDLEDDLDADDADVIPHQRLTINNTTALTAALARIALPTTTLPFSEHMSITGAEPTSIPDPDDDLAREQALYAQALDAATRARAALIDEGVPFTRPADYFAEMLKTDEHMGKVRARLLDAAARRKASQEARRARDAKKFGKAVQQERLKERAAAKRAALDGVNALKRKRGGTTGAAGAAGDDDFGVGLENAVEAAARERTERRAGAGGRGRDGEPNVKRQKKNEKFGFGGKKRRGKSNDATSTGDVRGFRGKGGSSAAPSGRPGGRKPVSGAAKRPGKARRAKMKS